MEQMQVAVAVQERGEEVPKRTLTSGLEDGVSSGLKPASEKGGRSRFMVEMVSLAWAMWNSTCLWHSIRRGPLKWS